MFTVIICTFNPHAERLQRTLDGIETAIAAFGSPVECFLVDNRSTPAVSARSDLRIPTGVQVVREEVPGLTAARLCGVRMASSPWLVFVDDDNVLDSGYLVQAAAIVSEYRQVAVFGGSITGEFETPVPPWLVEGTSSIGVCPLRKSHWSNIPDLGRFPPGAGLVIRKDLAEAWAVRVRTDQKILDLGRKGSSLASAEDTDLVLFVLDQGFGFGRFTGLKLLHLIPSGRLSFKYQWRLKSSIARSLILLFRIRGEPPPSKLNAISGLVRALFLMIKAPRQALLRVPGHLAVIFR